MHDEEMPIIYIDAKPKFRRYEDVYKVFVKMTGLMHETYKEYETIRLRLEKDTHRQVIISITFDSLEDRDKWRENRKYQELIVDLEEACKPEKFLEATMAHV